MKSSYPFWSKDLTTLFKYSLIVACLYTMQVKLLGIHTNENKDSEIERHEEREREELERRVRRAEEDAAAARQAAEEARRTPTYTVPVPAPYSPYGYRRRYPYYRRHHRGFFGFGW